MNNPKIPFVLKILPILVLSVLFCGRLDAQIADTLFFDTFSTTDLSHWIIRDDPQPRSGPSNWRVLRQELHQTSNIWSYDPPAEFIYHLGTHAATGDAQWDDYTINAVLRSTDNDGIGLLFRYQDASNYYRILLMNDPVNAGSAGAPIQRIQRFVNGQPTTLHQNIVDEAYPTGYFSLTADVRGDTISAYLNGLLIGRVVDNTYATGRIGVFTYANTGAVFDDILVTRSPVRYGQPDREIRYPITTNRKPYVQLPEPTQVYLAWNTVDLMLGTVELGTEKDVYTREISATQPVRQHRMRIDALQPDTRYYYRVLTNGNVFSEGYSFQTPPEPGERDETSFLVLGDSGTGSDNQRAVRNQMTRTFNEKQPELLIHVGDVHQGNGAEYDGVYFRIYEDLLQQIPFYLAIGNHDTYTDNGGPFLNDFILPVGNPHPQGRYYSHTWANVYFINLDTNIPFGKGTPQYDFLERALDDPARSAYDWTIAYFHHPPYSVYWPQWQGDPIVRRDLMPLFEQHGVDIVFNGHTHSYEYGLINGVRYVITGGGGGNLDPFGRDFDHVQFAQAVFHFGMVNVKGRRLEYEAIDVQGNRIHQFRIDKTATSVDDASDERPSGIQLHPNAPNPFNPETLISFEIPSEMQVELVVYNIVGQPVQTLVNGVFQAGLHRVSMHMQGLSSGVYVYSLVTPEGVIHRKMTLLK